MREITAEQVRVMMNRHATMQNDDDGMGNEYAIIDYDWQAIADELNATRWYAELLSELREEGESMIEFDVDMGYLLEAGELDCVVLNDENGEHESMEFVPKLGSGTCEKLPPLIEQTCIVRRSGIEMHFGYWRCSACQCENFEGARFCMNCGAKVVTP